MSLRQLAVPLVAAVLGGGVTAGVLVGAGAIGEHETMTVAIGNPFGLERTLTTGVVSALQRRITAPSGFAISNAIQTSRAAPTMSA